MLGTAFELAARTEELQIVGLLSAVIDGAGIRLAQGESRDEQGSSSSRRQTGCVEHGRTCEGGGGAPILAPPVDPDVSAGSPGVSRSGFWIARIPYGSVVVEKSYQCVLQLVSHHVFDVVAHATTVGGCNNSTIAGRGGREYVVIADLGEGPLIRGDWDWGRKN